MISIETVQEVGFWLLLAFVCVRVRQFFVSVARQVRRELEQERAFRRAFLLDATEANDAARKIVARYEGDEENLRAADALLEEVANAERDESGRFPWDR